MSMGIGFQKCLEIHETGCYAIASRAATPLAARPSAFWVAICFYSASALGFLSFVCYTIINSTRRASDRKVKQAGLLFLWRSSIAVAVEFSGFMCYSITNTPATPLSPAINAHFRQAFSFLGFPYEIWKARFI